jgi:hypothetical protein
LIVDLRDLHITLSIAWRIGTGTIVATLHLNWSNQYAPSQLLRGNEVKSNITVGRVYIPSALRHLAGN